VVGFPPIANRREFHCDRATCARSRLTGSACAVRLGDCTRSAWSWCWRRRVLAMSLCCHRGGKRGVRVPIFDAARGRRPYCWSSICLVLQPSGCLHHDSFRRGGGVRGDPLLRAAKPSSGYASWFTALNRHRGGRVHGWGHQGCGRPVSRSPTWCFIPFVHVAVPPPSRCSIGPRPDRGEIHVRGADASMPAARRPVPRSAGLTGLFLASVPIVFTPPTRIRDRLPFRHGGRNGVRLYGRSALLVAQGDRANATPKRGRALRGKPFLGSTRDCHTVRNRAENGMPRRYITISRRFSRRARDVVGETLSSPSPCAAPDL